MAELENWRYDAASFQKIGDITDRPHQVQHIIPNISRQSRTNHKQQYKSSFVLYWWHCYLLVIQHSIPQWGSHHSLFGLTGSLTNDKRKSGYWYEVAGENPQWSSTDFTTMLLLNLYHSPKQARARHALWVRWLETCNTLGFGLMSLRALAWGSERSLIAA